MDRYIGLDVHATSTTAAMVNGRGKKLGSTVLETNGRVLVQHVKGLSGTLHVCLEEGAQAGWIYEILSPHVAEVVVARVKRSRGPKSDKLDAFGLAEMLRRGAVDVRVFKEEGQYGALRQLVKVHLSAVQDTVRSQNRLKGLFRSRGVPVAGKSVYGQAGRDDWLAKLPAKSRTAAELLYAQYDATRELRDEAERELGVESRRHPICRVLETCPGLGTVRVARLVAMVITPHRFRRRSQFWAYCGLAIVMRSSSDWVQAPDGQWVKTELQRTRGLNKNHSHILKAVLPGVVLTPGPSGSHLRARGAPLLLRAQGRGDDGGQPASGEQSRAGLPPAARRRDQAEPRQAHRGPADRGDVPGDVEARGGVRPGQVGTDDSVARLASHRGGVGEGDVRSLSHEARETTKVRRRASIYAVDEVTRPAVCRRPEVPTDRLCPSGEPNEALARRGPDSRMVPAARGEHHGFHVSTAARGDGADDRLFIRIDRQAPAGHDAGRCELTRAGEQSLGADA